MQRQTQLGGTVQEVAAAFQADSERISGAEPRTLLQLDGWCSHHVGRQEMHRARADTHRIKPDMAVHA